MYYPTTAPAQKTTRDSDYIPTYDSLYDLVHGRLSQQSIEAHDDTIDFSFVIAPIK